MSDDEVVVVNCGARKFAVDVTGASLDDLRETVVEETAPQGFTVPPDRILNFQYNWQGATFTICSDGTLETFKTLLKTCSEEPELTAVKSPPLNIPTSPSNVSAAKIGAALSSMNQMNPVQLAASSGGRKSAMSHRSSAPASNDFGTQKFAKRIGSALNSMEAVQAYIESRHLSPQRSTSRNAAELSGSEASPSRKAQPEQQPHVVTLFVAECANLQDRDTSFGTGQSDPFVIVYDGNKKEVLRTPVADNTLNPSWPVDKASVQITFPPSSAHKRITLEVWDYNTVKNDFLGQASWSGVELLSSNEQTALTAPLRPREKENDPFILSNASKLGSVKVYVKVHEPGKQVMTAVAAAAAATPSHTSSSVRKSTPASASSSRPGSVAASELSVPLKIKETGEIVMVPYDTRRPAPPFIVLKQIILRKIKAISPQSPLLQNISLSWRCGDLERANEVDLDDDEAVGILDTALRQQLRDKVCLFACDPLLQSPSRPLEMKHLAGVPKVGGGSHRATAKISTRVAAAKAADLD